MKFLVGAFVFVTMSIASAQLITGDAAKKRYEELNQSGATWISGPKGTRNVIRKDNVQCTIEIADPISGIERERPQYTCVTFDIKPGLSADELCTTYSAENQKAPGKSLSALRKALGTKSLGTNADEADGPLERLGFAKLSTEKDLGAALEMAPKGSIFVLKKPPGSSCPVSREFGHIAVKCGPDSYNVGGVRNITAAGFKEVYGSCVKAMMVNELWLADTSAGEAKSVEKANRAQ